MISRPLKRERRASDVGGSGGCGDGDDDDKSGVVERKRQDNRKGKEVMVDPPPPPPSNLFRNLPTEIFLRILSHLTPHELVQSASCSREWYYIASDPLLWRILDLSALDSKLFNPKTATTLTQRLRSCRSFTLCKPQNLTQDHVTALLHFLSASPVLEQLHLQSLGSLLNSHSLEHHFRMSQSRCLMHVDLSHSPVTTPAVVALMDRHRGTLRSLDLSHTAIGDGTLRAVSQAKALHTLEISFCTSVSRTSIRNFLCKRFPGCIVTLSLRGLRDVKITWLYDLMKLPTSGNLKVLNVEGCERLTLGDLRELQEAFQGRIEIRHDAHARPGDDSVWGYRRYIEFLSTDPSLPERLGEEKLKAMESSSSSSCPPPLPSTPLPSLPPS